MKRDNILSVLGLAKAGGNLVSGGFSTEDSIRKGTAFLVIVAEDASDNTKKLFTNKCMFYGIPIVLFSNKQEIGKALGYEMRTSLAVTDEGIAKSLIKKLQDRNISFISLGGC